MRKFIFTIGFSILIGPIFCQKLTPKYAGSEKLTRILFVLDASNSMYGRWENGTKMEIAQRLMNRMVDSLSEIQDPNFQLALRVYGHQKPVPPQDCNDTKLEVPFRGKIYNIEVPMNYEVSVAINIIHSQSLRLVCTLYLLHQSKSRPI